MVAEIAGVRHDALVDVNAHRLALLGLCRREAHVAEALKAHESVDAARAVRGDVASARALHGARGAGSAVGRARGLAKGGLAVIGVGRADRLDHALLRAVSTHLSRVRFVSSSVRLMYQAPVDSMRAQGRDRWTRDALRRGRRDTARR